MATLNNVITNANGCVGIGTSSPTVKLDVVGSATVSNALTVTGTTALNGAVNLSTSGTPTITLGSASSYGVLTASGTNAASIYLNGASRTGFEAKLQFGAAEHQWFNGSLSSQIMTLNTTGLGIGTTSPTRKLHIDGGATTTVGIYIDANGISGTDIEQSSDAFRFQIRDNIPALFYTNNTERMRITSDGKVGIGTSSPNNRLDVVGGTGTTFNMSNDSDSLRGGKLTFISSSATGRQFYVGTTSAIYNLVFGIDSVEKARIDTNGNLGIGTTTVNQKLSIYPGTTGGIALQDSGGTTRSYFFVDNTNPTYSTGIRTENYYLDFDSSGGAQNAIRFYTGTSSIGTGTERMRITSAGNVGIGTSNPGYKLEVLGLVNVVSAPGSYGAMFRARDSVTLGTESFGGVHFTSSPGTDYTIGKWTTAAGAGLLQIRDQSGNKFFTIDGAGNVGIGTTTLSSLLTLNGTYPQIIANNPSTGSGVVIQLRDNGRDAGFMGHSTTTARLQFGSRGVANTQMTLDYNGNLGIGTTSPLARLHVTGSSSVPAAILMGNVGIGTTSFVYSNAARGDVEVYGSTDALISLRNATANSYLQKTGNDFYFNNGGAGFISITTNTSERMRITSDGNVGIGTSSPGEKLGILNGNIQLLATSGDPYIRLTDNGVRNWYLKVVDTLDYFEVGGTNTTSLVVKGDGNVGIGTTNPTAALDVSRLEYPSLGGILASFTAGTTTPTTEKYVYLKQTYTGAAYDSPMLAFRANANSVNSGSFGTVRTTSNGSIAFSNVNATSGTVTAVSEKMRIQADGNVGIGTTSPTANLTVYNSSTPTIDFNTGTSTSRGRISATSSDFTIAALTSSPLIFKIDSGEKVRIAADGNVGIGTTSPAQKFSVIGNIYLPQGNYITWNNGDCEIAGVSGFHLTFRTYTGVTMTEKLRIQSDGNVGIGTTSPAYKLEVNGSLYATRLSGSAMFTTSGKGRFYGTASYALAAPGGGSSLTGQTDSVTPFETSLGHQAGNSNTGVANTAVGYQALFSNTVGSGSVAVGHQALRSNITGNFNVAVGALALNKNTAAIRNTAVGYQSLYNNTTDGNSAFGYQALKSNTTGIQNSAFGALALLGNTTGGANTAFGYIALFTNTFGNYNTAVGSSTLNSNTTGIHNVAIGANAMFYNTTGSKNTTVGSFALYNSAGSGNSSFGYKSLLYNITGVNNCAFGSGSLYNNTSGTKNTAVGGNAGSTITTGTNLSLFGYNAQASTATATNQITLGNSSVATLRCQVTTITALSDFRDKTDINNVEVGLSFVEKLRPVTFKWDRREWYTDGNRDGSKKDSTIHTGFIAQELKELQESENATYLNLVLEDNPDKLEATPGNLMVPLIKAVQELSVMVKQQRVEFDDKIAKQQLEIDYLKSKLNN